LSSGRVSALLAEVKRIFFITGTDTGVGKTVLTALLARYLRERGVNVAALKPVSSGDRHDARALGVALAGALALDEINPWHFRAAVAPVLAARREHKCVRLAEVLAYVQGMQKRFNVVLVEGAGGLLSPLGVSGSRNRAYFNSRDLILALRATPVVVCPNRLGAVNQALLTLAALPPSIRAGARVVLMLPPHPDAASGSNAILLADCFDPKRIFRLPWLGEKFAPGRALQRPAACEALRGLTGLE